MRKGIYKDSTRNTWMIDTKVTIDGVAYSLKRRGYATKTAANEDYQKAVNDLFLLKQRSKNADYFINLTNEFLEYKKTKVRLSTYHNNWLRFIKVHILSRYGSLKVDEVVNPISLRSFRNEILSMDVKTNYKNRILKAFKDIIKYGYDRNYVNGDAFKNVNVELEYLHNSGLELKAEKKVWTKEQYFEFMNALGNNKYAILFDIFFHIGCRVGELRGLQVKDYDPSTGFIHIRQQANSKVGTGKAEITLLKVQTGSRYIELSKRVNKLLKDFVINGHFDSESFIFFGQKNPLSETSIRFVLDKYSKLAKIPHLQIHEIRHTNATWLISNAHTVEEVMVISRRLGHKSVKQTLDTYGHLLNKKQSDLFHSLV